MLMVNHLWRHFFSNLEMNRGGFNSTPPVRGFYTPNNRHPNPNTNQQQNNTVNIPFYRDTHNYNRNFGGGQSSGSSGSPYFNQRRGGGGGFPRQSKVQQWEQLHAADYQTPLSEGQQCRWSKIILGRWELIAIALLLFIGYRRHLPVLPPIDAGRPLEGPDRRQLQCQWPISKTILACEKQQWRCRWTQKSADDLKVVGPLLGICVVAVVKAWDYDVFCLAAILYICLSMLSLSLIVQNSWKRNGDFSIGEHSLMTLCLVFIYVLPWNKVYRNTKYVYN